jgi:hypothetical protein
LLLFRRVCWKPVGMMLFGKTLVRLADGGRINRVVNAENRVCVHERKEVGPSRGGHAPRSAEYVPVCSGDWVAQFVREASRS